MNGKKEAGFFKRLVIGVMVILYLKRLVKFQEMLKRYEYTYTYYIGNKEFMVLRIAKTYEADLRTSDADMTNILLEKGLLVLHCGKTTEK